MSGGCRRGSGTLGIASEERRELAAQFAGLVQRLRESL